MSTLYNIQSVPETINQYGMIFYAAICQQLEFTMFILKISIKNKNKSYLLPIIL